MLSVTFVKENNQRIHCMNLSKHSEDLLDLIKDAGKGDLDVLTFTYGSKKVVLPKPTIQSGHFEIKRTSWLRHLIGMIRNRA